MIKKYIYKILIILGIVTADQVTKFLLDGKDFVVINNVLSFSSSHNTGAAWSMFDGQMLLFIGGAFVFLIVMFLFDYFQKDQTKLYTLGFSIILAGAIGNLIDRIAFGYVRDFIKTEFINFPIFNIADIALVCGAILFSVYILFFAELDDKKDKKNEK